jgi:tetratricopeptide (TPR) repeat protein
MEQAGLLAPGGPAATRVYDFRHILIQESAYSTMLRADRRRLHRIVGETLETLYPDHLNELAPTLARHFAQAGADTKAAHYYARAGAAALARFANQEAEAAYRAALALAGPDEAVALYMGLGQALVRQGHYPDAQAIWAVAVPLAQAAGDLDSVAQLYTLQARAAWASGDLPGGLALCQAGISQIGEGPPTPGRAALLHEWARAAIHNGHADAAVAPAQAALQMAEALGAVEVQVETLATLALLPSGDPPALIAALAAAIEQAEAAGLLVAASRAHNNRAELLEQWGDLATARAHYARGLVLFERIGVPAGQLWFYNNLARVALLAGELDAVRALLPRLRHLLRATPHKGQVQLGVQVIEAELAYYSGDVAGALPLLDACYQAALATKDGQMITRLILDLIAAELDLAADEDADAPAHLERAWTLAGARPADKSVALCCARVAVAARRGNLPLANTWLAAAQAAALHPRSMRDQADLALAAARLAAAAGDRPQAASGFAAAAWLHEASGRHTVVAQIRREEAALQRPMIE